MGLDEFDEEKYLAANPDVGVMVARGLFRSPLDHWQRSGSLEHAAGRRRSGFYEHDRLYDEETYLRLNPDVLAHLRKRLIGSGYEHWMRYGRVEFSRGRRQAPFVANRHAFRAFRLSFGPAGELLVAATGSDPRTEGELAIRHGADAAIAIPQSSVRWTGSLGVVDAFHRPRSLRLALVRLPPLGVEGRRPRPLELLAGGASIAVAPDAGMQAFFFADSSDANEFLSGALEAAAGSSEIEEALAAFTVGRLQRPPDAGEPVSEFFLEALARREGSGFEATGWFSPPEEGISRVTVFCPDTCEVVDLASVERLFRPDVLRQLGIDGASPEARLGFRAFFPLPLASTRTPARLVFGVTPKSSVVRFFENRDAARLLGE